MKSYRFDEFGGLDHLNLHDEPMPTARPGEVVVRVEAVSLNYRDVAIPTGRHPLPHSPGLIPTSDAAGVIVEVGDSVDVFSLGDRVLSNYHPRWLGGWPPTTMTSDLYGRGRDGWLTEYKTVNQDSVVRLPSTMSALNACTLPCAAVTAWSALQGPDPVCSGQWVLTMGTGGVSLFALQFAKASGAQVVATTSSPEKAEILKAMGATHVVDYTADPAWGLSARRVTGGNGFDRVVEVGGAGTMTQSLKAIKGFSEIALVGFLDRSATSIDYGELFRSNANLRQVRVGHRQQLEQVVEIVNAHGIEPLIDSVFSFESAPDAFRHLNDAKPIGKVVIEVSSSPVG